MFEPTQDEEDQCGDHSEEVVEEEEHHSWPLIILTNATKKIKTEGESKNKQGSKLVADRGLAQEGGAFEFQTRPVVSLHDMHLVPSR
ncbi:hypothetical protein Hanom_Chr12g01166661 [Helianthus anomalus]